MACLPSIETKGTTSTAEGGDVVELRQLNLRAMAESPMTGQLTKYDQILVQKYVHFEQVNVLTDDLCCAKNVVLCSAGEKQMSLNLLISCGGVIATLSIARSATGRMLVKSV